MLPTFGTQNCGSWLHERDQIHMDKTPDIKCMAYTRVKPHHDAIYVVVRDGAQKENFEFYKTLNGCLNCFTTISKKYIEKVNHIRHKAETYAKIRGAVAHIPSMRSLMSVPWRRTSSSTANVIGIDALLEEKLCARSKKQIPRTQGATFSEPGNLRLPEKRKLWRWRTDLKENLVRILQHGPGRHSVLCQWWKANQLVERAREASWTIAPRVPCLHSSSHRARDKISKRERQNLRASRAQQLYGPKVQFNCGKMGFWTSFIAKVSVSKDVIEHIVWSLGSYCNHSDQNRSNIPRHEGRKRSSVVRLEDRKRRQIGSFRRRQPEPRIFFSVSADIGTSSRSVKPYAKFGTIRRNVRRKRRQKRKHTLKRIGQDGAVSLPPPWSCCDLRWH